MFRCAICGDRCKGANIDVVRDLWGRKQKIIVCAFCGDFIRSRRRE